MFMWTREELKTNAKELLKANYWKAFLAAAVISVMAGANQRFINFGNTTLDNAKDTASTFTILAITFGTLLFCVIFSIFVVNPFTVGSQKLLLNCKEDCAQNSDLVFAFKNSYFNIVKTLFMQKLITSVFTLLFVIPGIIKAYEYRMVPYLLAENPDMDWREALNTSKEMMDGQKWNTFVLDMSFFGWHLLSIFTCGILEPFYVTPYNLLTNAELYHALKN